MSLTFHYQRTIEGAVPPRKAHPEDSGYDLTVVALKNVENGVYYYDTGIVVEPPQGHYFEIYARSSLCKSGHMLANNVGIIDANYRGNLIVALVKVQPDAADLELPARIAQLIPRQLIHFEAEEAESLTETVRGSGCFGSTGN
jgi:dUTP pyrophosphatase